MQLSADFYLRRITETLSSPDQIASSPPRQVRGDADLLKIPDDPTFLSAAYAYYLKRSPDLSGFDHFIAAMQKGEKRQTILKTLRQSAEAVYGVHAPVATAAPLPPAEVPEEWRLIQTPKRIELDELLLLPNARQFVESAYQRVLRRPPDAIGLEQNVDAVLRGIPREFVLQQICSSAEARSRPDTFFVHGRDASRVSITQRLRAVYRSLIPSRSYLARLTADRVEALSTRVASIEHNLRKQSEDELHEQRRSVEALAAQLTEVKALLTHSVKRPYRQVRPEREERVGDPASTQELAIRVQETSVNVITKLDAIAADVEARQIGILRAIEAGRASLGHIWTRVQSPVLPAGDGLVVTAVGGFLVSIPVEEWRLAMSLGSGDDLEPGLVRCLQQLVKPGMVVVDVGANVGLITLHAAVLAGPHGAVFSLEPAPRTFVALRENVRVNGFLDGRRLMLRQAAVSDQTGRAKLWTQPHNCGHDTMFPEAGDNEAIEVETIALDDLLADEPHVDVIKIDAEGAEPLIWRGMQKTLQRHRDATLLIEYAPGHLRRAGLEPERFLDEIQSSGFQMWEVHHETGELRPAGRASLRDTFSVNLCLRRAQPDLSDNGALPQREPTGYADEQ